MELSNKIWMKIQESFQFKKIKSKAPKLIKKKSDLNQQNDLNIDEKEIIEWSSQNIEILK